MYLSRCDEVEEAGITSVLYDSFLTGLFESQNEIFFFLSFNLGLEIIKRYFANLQVQTVFPD